MRTEGGIHKINRFMRLVQLRATLLDRIKGQKCNTKECKSYIEGLCKREVHTYSRCEGREI